MLTSGRVLWNSGMKMGVNGAMDNGVKTLMKTKMAWLMMTMAFHFGLQFYGAIRVHFACF